ncbi:MAG: HAD family phosphatase [Desulfomonilaceae bacterium]
MKRAINDILFDLGNVLVPVHWETAFRNLLPHLPPDRAKLLKEDRQAFIDLLREPATALEKGETDSEQFYIAAAELLGTDLNREDFLEMWCNIFSINETMISLGESLSKRYGTWLMSNTSRLHYEYIVRKFPRVTFYKCAALSYDLGVMKPSANYYEKAIEKFRIDPISAVFIDDLPENVEGAVRSGMMGVVFRNSTQLLQELRSLGVNVPESE